MLRFTPNDFIDLIHDAYLIYLNSRYPPRFIDIVKYISAILPQRRIDFNRFDFRFQEKILCFFPGRLEGKCILNFRSLFFGIFS